MDKEKDQLFEMGQMVVTGNCLNKLEADGEFEETREFITRHISGDWGDLCKEDKQVNKEALETGDRLMSAYKTSSGTDVWVITDAVSQSGHREVTTVLLPEDY